MPASAGSQGGTQPVPKLAGSELYEPIRNLVRVALVGWKSLGQQGRRGFDGTGKRNDERPTPGGFDESVDHRLPGLRVDPFGDPGAGEDLDPALGARDEEEHAGPVAGVG